MKLGGNEWPVQTAPDDPAVADREGETLAGRLGDTLSLVDNAPDVLSRFDRNLRYRFVNKTAERSTGIPREAFLGKTFRELGFPEENCHQWEEALRRVFETGEPASIDFSVPLPAGLRHFEGTAVAERDAGGEVETVLTAVRDVTERREAAEALRRREQEFTALVESSPDIISRFTSDLRLVYTSPSVQRYTGMPPAFFLGKTHAEMGMPEEMCATADACLRRVFATGQREAIEFCLPSPDGGDRCFEAYAVPQFGDGGAVESVMTVSRDVTDRRLAEEALENAFRHQYRIATALQKALLQVPPPDAFPGLSFAPFYESAGQEAEVGGDFFDVLPLAGGKVALAVGDISGKGLEAAARMTQVKFVLRAYLQEYDGPARTLDRLNDFLLGAPRTDPTELGAAFACLALAVVDPGTGEAFIAVAGAEAPLLYRAGGGGETIASGGLPLGIDRRPYEEEVVTLLPGDLLVMATDGITEARNGRVFLGSEGLDRLVREALPLRDVERVGQAVLRGVRRFAEGPLRDDVCLLLARRT